MLYKETGFRAVYKQFCSFPIGAARGAVKGFPGADTANCILTYGYIDREAGLSLEILACGISKDGKSRFFDTLADVRSFIRIGAVMDVEFSVIDPGGDALYARYKDKIDMLSHYDPENEDVEESRKLGFLDSCRHEEYPDDVLVYLLKEGLKPERCWARISGLQKPCIIGELLNEPHQDLKYHLGEKIAMFAREDENKEIILISDMNPSVNLTRKDLEDGQLLKNAIHVFNEDRTEAHFIDVLEFLRDSEIWIPCNAILGEADAKLFEEQFNAADGDVDTLKENLVGKTFTSQDNIRLVPDILQNGDDYYFPAFTSEKEMGEYGDHFSKIPDHFLHTIILARNNEKDVKGIVLNAFSEPFILDRDLFDMVEKMKSRLSDEEDPASALHQVGEDKE